MGFHGGHALAMPFAALDGVRRGCRAVVATAAGTIRPSERWLGRVVNAMGEPIDGQGALPPGPAPYPFRSPAHTRMRVGEPLDLGVRALNTFLTVCRGQRMGIFSGSGVGKSVLLSMLARNVSADVSVIGLVGERGREVQEFLQDDLGPAGLARSVVVVSTSDEPALMRRQAAYLTLAIAEYFRDVGKGIFSVLVDGDDHNEPVADAVRGILDGHIVMERTMPRAADPAYLPAINRARQVMATYSDMEELIRLGGYRAGSSAEVDGAIALHKPLEAFLSQLKEESTSMAEGYQRLGQILQTKETEN